MKLNIAWPDSINEAKAVQAALKDSVKIVPLRRKPKFIAGVDAAFSGDKVIAVASLYKYPDLMNLEGRVCNSDMSFPIHTRLFILQGRTCNH